MIKEHYFMRVALETAKLSYCKRNQVGAVLVKNNRIISCGYNGTVSGHKNVCEDEIEVCPYCNSKDVGEYDDVSFYCNTCGKVFPKPKKTLVTSPFTVHAEMNAIAFAAKAGISTDGCDMYVTLSPCPDCAKLIVQSGIKRVFYYEEYRNKDGINFLRDCGINVRQIKEIK